MVLKLNSDPLEKQQATLSVEPSQLSVHFDSIHTEHIVITISVMMYLLVINGI